MRRPGEGCSHVSGEITSQAHLGEVASANYGPPSGAGNLCSIHEGIFITAPLRTPLCADYFLLEQHTGRGLRAVEY